MDITTLPRSLLIVVPLAGAIGSVAGQTPLQFEVASIKASTSDVKRVGIQTLPGGRFIATSVSARELILFAYNLQPPQLTGGSGWIESERFDIVAKGEPDEQTQFEADRRNQPSRAQLMLRTLLADRFRLEMREERRELAVYALVRARSGGPLGPAMRSSSADCSATEGRSSAGPACGIRFGGRPGALTAGGATMSQLAATLTGWAGRVVVDRTEIASAYDFTLSWTPDQVPRGIDRKVAAGGLPPPDPDGPSLFTAVQEQLGLKLEPQKAPVSVFVITRAERPTEN